ncbi:MAG: DUF1549 and DUF1553 domain-containing protein [Gemmataceae bacterium]|nr:DUF1549 and DUF1553 domain-containing protein [Gemmataceae bacterium]MDW8264242.1 DUF1549 domain-containing protein [Gemmataceae bacterium]
MRVIGLLSPTMPLSLLLGAAHVLLWVPTGLAAGEIQPDQKLVGALDRLMEEHWREVGATPADPVDDAGLLRRLSLDLLGRIPTLAETRAFLADPSPDRRARLVLRLLNSPEYPLQMGRVLDEIVQAKFAGDAESIDYFRRAMAAGKSWEQMFREVLLGPWDTPDRQGAARFLLQRLRNLDDLTNDSAIAFFGVNVSCAKCHDHPLVDDWKQDHYFGLASFFNATYEGSKSNRGKSGSAAIAEKATMPITFNTTKGERRTAKLMFLSGRVVEATAPTGLRHQLVQVALEDKTFFSRAIVNRLWDYFIGRGLVSPVDQMHSGNPPVVTGVLELLADDLVAHGYDLNRLVAALVSSRVYQLASVPSTPGEPPDEALFAVAPLRPLTPAQYALSLVVAAGEPRLDAAASPADRVKAYRELEGAAATLLNARLFDTRGERYQASAGEALFMSNNPDVQKWMVPVGSNLAARLSALSAADDVVDTAVAAILSRSATQAERSFLSAWLRDRGQDRAKAGGQLIWALVTSAEFRFNH